MSIELKKEVVQLTEAACRMSCEAFVEADIIVPDVKPDIAKILQIDANPVIMEKNIFADRVVFEGQISLCILYISDDGCCKSIHTIQKFSHTVAPKGINEDMALEAYCSLIKLDYRLINSRKISINATVGIDFAVTKDVLVDVCTDVLDSEACHCQYEPATAYIAAKTTTEEVLVREALELPVGKPDVDEVLKIDARVSNKDVRITGNKAVVKGDIICTMLYSSGYDVTTVQQSEHEIGFTEIVDVPVLLDEFDSSIDFIVKMISFSIQPDSDGDNRIVVVDILLDAMLGLANTVNMNILSDAFSTSHDLDISKKQIQLDELVSDLKMQSTFKSTASLPPVMPEVVQVYSISAVPHLANAVLQAGSVQISGEIEVVMLYQSADSSVPINSLTHMMPFAQTIESETASPQMSCDANVAVDHIGYTMSMPNEIDLRCILGISAKVLNPKQTAVIESIEEKELPATENCNKYCIKIYFVQECDTLWSIAKKYHISVEKLAAANDLDECADLMVGQQIIIPQ